MKPVKTRLLRIGYILIISLIFMSFATNIFYTLDAEKTNEGLAQKNLPLLLMSSELKNLMTAKQYLLSGFVNRNDISSLYFLERNQKEIRTLLDELHLYDLSGEERSLLTIINRIYESVEEQTETLLTEVRSSRDDPEASQVLRAYSSAVNSISVAVNFTDRLIREVQEDYEIQRSLSEERYRYATAITLFTVLIALITSTYFYRFLSKMLKQLETSGMRDGLTGLLNKQALSEMIAKEIHQAHRIKRPLSLAIVDIDHFKKVNDVYGHMAGDEVLKMLAKLLKSNCRDYDITGRFGGEEFILVFPDTPLSAAAAVAERIRQETAAASFSFEKKSIQITVSIGLAQWQEGSVEDLIHQADEKMYVSKRNGRNRVTY